ncbi:MAG: hypothetical protein R2744_03695 [Bacteroidales bacterium]
MKKNSVNESGSNPCLTHLSCFDALTASQLEKVVNASTRHIVFNRGETICKQGVLAPSVIFLD